MLRINFVTDKAIIKTSEIISSLNRNLSFDMSIWYELRFKNVYIMLCSVSCILRKHFCVILKFNTLYNTGCDVSI